MSHAIRLNAQGGPENLSWEEITLPPLAAGEVRLRQRAVGVNFVDIYQRSGLYSIALPSGLGQEGAGVVEAVGKGVKDFAVGDRAAYAGGPIGAYAEVRDLPAHRLVRLPQGISDIQAAGIMLRGLTAQYLLRRIFPVKAGQTILVHAAAGGVGLILCQWANALGATVIGITSTKAKAELARANGCHHPISYDNFPEKIKELTQGVGVPVVYDSVGQDTFINSLNCLSPMGMMVSYGNASGAVKEVEMSQLAKKSLFITRPTLGHYTAKREDLLHMTAELFEMVLSDKIKITVGQTYPLREAARAHADMEARKTTGSTVLTVVG